MTVVGPITGLKEGRIGMTPYRFVTMNVTGFKRWHLVQQVVMPPAPMGPWAGAVARGARLGAGYGWYNLARHRCKPL